MFGQSGGFGQQPTAQTSSSGSGKSGFGQPAATPAFGQANTPGSTGFGTFGNASSGQTNSGFGQANNTLGQNNTGTNQASSAFGQNSSAFGASNSTFGKTGTTFGQPASGTGFGQTSVAPAQNASGFGTNSTAFGKPSSTFGQNSTTFGQNSTGFGTASSGFGQTSSAFGQTNTGFGTASTGAGQNTSGFGNSAFGQASSAFKPNTSSFGQTGTGTGFGLNNSGVNQGNSGFGLQNKSGFGNTTAFGGSTGTTNSLLTGNTAQAANPAPSVMDQRINHFLTIKSDSNVDQLPQEAQKLLGEIQQSLLNKKKALASLRSQMQSVENSLQSNCTEISDAVIGTLNVDLLLKAGVDRLELLEQRQLSSSDLVPVQTLLQVAQKGCSPSTFDERTSEVLKYISSEVSFQALQYETAIKKLDVSSGNLKCLAKLDQTDGLKSFIGVQHSHTCELSSKAKEVMERSRKVISSCAGSRYYETLKDESPPRSLISSLYDSHDFNFDPTLLEIACEDLEPHS